ncbi:Peroxidase [Mycena sanguinolenta]|uniref:Peroxidase n=1 Tax=Mycena sanguinolenta TaxID=230812 RepID=A0A8H6XQ14_9AGAR|nr:Peroxidase [Mycena sanguinolenta]
MRHSFTFLLRLVCIFPLVFGTTPAVFHWPDPAIDSMDEILYRPNNGVGILTTVCNARNNSSIAAQWLRIAYHDMATHDSVAGTGGLDASIMFELDRPQNIGLGMLLSLDDFALSPNEHVAMADIIAMGVINALIGCGGPIVPFRGGRIDATEAGPETVPEPQQDLASHTAAFARQGFNATEMISLVACGHSLGGVRQADFPLVVTEDVPTGVQLFASKIGFDPKVVTEYLDSTTQNVLVVGSNVTTRSDMRIFFSDGNVTMQSMASADKFNQICGDLIERMINTVPSTVTLTDPIEPIDFKVWNTVLYPQDGSLTLLTTMRIINSSLKSTVTLFWKERTGTFCPAAGCSVPSFQVQSAQPSFLAALKGVTGYTMHSFNASIDLATSISYFWFEVTNNDGSAPVIINNQGANFTIDQDVLLFVPPRTTFTSAGLDMVVAVKDLSGTVDVTSTTTLHGNASVPIPSTVTSNFELDSSIPAADGYTFYSASISSASLSNTVHATIDGTAYSLWVPQPLAGVA